MATKPHTKKRHKKTLTRELSRISHGVGEEYEEFGAKPSILQKPPNQEIVSEEELKKDVSIMLSANNPYFRDSFAEFSFKDLAYKTISNFPNTVFFYTYKGCIEHNIMKEDDGLDDIRNATAASEQSVEELDTKRKNKFNFCDRAIQTMNLTIRDQSLQTEPPPQMKSSETASLADIIMTYKQKEEANKQKEEVEKKTKITKRMIKAGKLEQFMQHQDFLRLCERMVDQNLLFEVNVDFSFYDNPSDEFMDKGHGSLLPLWKFRYRKMRGMSITSLSWNMHYPDMFAVGYGTYDVNLTHQTGTVCIFSLKCPSYPERVIACKSSVQSVHFHPRWSHLLAVGFSEGTVSVYDLRFQTDVPCATSLHSKIQHSDIVNQVNWLPDNIDLQHNFCSVSADGKVLNWLLAKSELVPAEVISVKEKDYMAEGSEGVQMNVASGGSSISFNTETSELFIVATESGLIHKCSNLYTALYLETFRDHTNNVYNVEWNPFHPRVFLSCSADWTIRIWDHSLKEAVFIFDLFCEVKDVTWAPFSSSVFAAVAKNGKVHVFDLMMNRQSATCSYMVHGLQSNINLTTVRFNPIKPVIILGDDRGYVRSFKLSPNLRSSLKALGTMEKSKFAAVEIEKMEKILKLAKSREGKMKN